MPILFVNMIWWGDPTNWNPMPYWERDEWNKDAALETLYVTLINRKTYVSESESLNGKWVGQLTDYKAHKLILLFE